MLNIAHHTKTIITSLKWQISIQFNIFQSKDVVDSTKMIVLVTQMFWAFILSLIFCEIGDFLSNSFDKIGGEFSYINWYLLPIVIQRNILLFMSFSHRHVVLSGFGSITGSREVFKEVSLDNTKFQQF